MSDPIVYKDTPLGDYFEGTVPSLPEPILWASLLLVDVCLVILILGTGTFETDYGVSSDHELSSRSSTSSSHHRIHDFAPPLSLPRKKFTASKQLKPLIILNENISRSTKFYNLFSVSLRPSSVIHPILQPPLSPFLIYSGIH